ncbi:MAG: Holliday junction resolvase RuvX [Chitinivibrionales bacterium]|nr:Holliday junction resolvase RuvX [Chitinivibrionales bacterium]
MKLVGIDYGRRRIGIAVTDESGKFIRGCATIDRKISKDPVSDVVKYIKELAAEELVFGLPLGPHDEETVMSQEVRSFANRITAQLTIALPCHFVDESFSSLRAHELLSSRKKKQRRDKAAIDRLAACTILETFQKYQSFFGVDNFIEPIE